jgi:CheY-like chemotaxis protein
MLTLFLYYQTSSDSALAMVDDLTFATTFEAGEISQATPFPIHIPSLLLQIIRAVNTVEQRGGRAVEIRLSTVGMTAEVENRLADPCLYRVIYSLLSNAVRYSPPAGQHVDLIVTYSAENDPECYRDGPVGSKRMRDDSPVTVNSSKTGSVASTAQCCGSFTFTIKNSTVTPMDPTTVRKYFSAYYHFDSASTEQTPTPTPAPESFQADQESLSSVVDDGDDHLTSKKSQSIPSSCSVSSLEAANLNASSSTLSSTTSSGSSSGHSGSGYRDLKSVKGLGLGLYTAFSMVKIMGGHLKCSASSHEACFWFSVSLPPCLTALPISEIPTCTDVMAVLGEPVAAIGDVVSSSNTCEVAKLVRVLIVDDSSMCQKVIVKSLKGLEFLTEVASNGWEACEKLQQTPCRFDAVLMDLRMPVMDGLEATRYCREVLKLCDLPIIAITAEIGSAIREEAIKSGASHFLSKPAKAQEIISLLRSLDFYAEGGSHD